MHHAVALMTGSFALWTVQAFPISMKRAVWYSGEERDDI